ncbi:MAG: PSP1 domain-containing protein [Planctomycetota bacterium]|jgi:cell fate regulator YaaT (PSP1 superfamily)
MRIEPLPVFEADADPHHRLALNDEELYAQLEPPKTIVVCYGLMKQVAEFPHDGDAKPGCGTKLVARTSRGTELVEMLTTTCENAGCSKSITRNELLDYIEHSGGRDFPFHTDGRILRVATIEDLNAHAALDTVRKEAVRRCKRLIVELGLPMKLVEVEPILGGELLTFYYMAEERVDFRELVRNLASEFSTRIEMRQVGARDEARLVADYERCGQHCCCKNFLKVLKPISMKSAKLQKATLDPLKISGRCGRLMCCLRYEDHTYRDLKARLPHRKTRVGTVEGPGEVVDGKVLVQLVLVRLEHDGREIAVPVEELLDPDKCPEPGAVAAAERAAAEALIDPLRGMKTEDVERRTDEKRRGRRRRRSGRRGRPAKAEQQDADRRKAKAADTTPSPAKTGERPAKRESDAGAGAVGKKKGGRRRRRRRRRGPGGGGSGGGGNAGGGGGG